MGHGAQPRLAGIDQDGLDALVGQPLQHSAGDELRAVVGAQIQRRAALADQARQHLDDAARADLAVDLDRQALLGPFVGDGQALELLAMALSDSAFAHQSNTKSYDHTWLAPVGAWGRGRPLAVAKTPLAAPPPRDGRFGSPLKLSKVHWVKPELVVEVTYLTWTEDNVLRQVSYQGQREDMPAQAVVRPVSYP